MGALGAALRGTPRMSWHRRDRRGPRQGQINNEKPQVCGLRAPAKGLLADFAPPRKGGGEAAGIRYVAKTGKVLFGLTDTALRASRSARATAFTACTPTPVLKR
jgi:hypothetical protein